MEEFEPNRKLLDRIEWLCKDMGVLEDVDFEQELRRHDSIGDLDELNDIVYDSRILDVEVCYYATAIEYLSKEDPSLIESLEIAAEYGFDLKSLNSEILASLHMSRENAEDWTEVSRRLCEDDFDTEADRRDHVIGQLLD